MWLLVSCFVSLIAGYFVYGKFVERIFGVDPQRRTPALTMADGVDFIPLPTWKVFLIQLLDIAGIGPIFGPILAALYGPAALIWIVLGAIFAGGVHDFFSGWAALRNGGKNVPEIVGDALGPVMRQLMRAASLLLLLLVGVVFVLSPAKLLAELTGWPAQTLTIVIFIYYFLAVILPIDKLIGRVYGVFGALLIFMSLGILWGLLFDANVSFAWADVARPGFLANTHPGNKPIWPLMFITLSCGALSGFHSTQSPIMARCLKSEKQARLVFYGAMIVEGMIALIWAFAALSCFESPAALNEAIAAGTPSLVVKQVSSALLGMFGVVAVLGVIILPITSGDTAFRGARLIVADILRLDQKSPIRRLVIALPLFALGFLISFHDFDVIWRHFGWANQTLAALALWSAAVFLSRARRPHWIASVPAVFMTAVTVTTIMYTPIGFRQPLFLSTVIGCVAAAASMGWMLVLDRRNRGPR